MSGTTVIAKRYMKLCAYLSVALRSETRDALLIGFDVGSTLRASRRSRRSGSIGHDRWARSPAHAAPTNAMPGMRRDNRAQYTKACAHLLTGHGVRCDQYRLPVSSCPKASNLTEDGCTLIFDSRAAHDGRVADRKKRPVGAGELVQLPRHPTICIDRGTICISFIFILRGGSRHSAEGARVFALLMSTRLRARLSSSSLGTRIQTRTSGIRWNNQ
jgi:hypothetical protein